MGAIANALVTLASAVADDATVAIAYPAGTTKASIQGSTGGQVMIGQNGPYVQGVADNVDFAFGASTITITNRTGAAWPAGSEMRVSFGETNRNGSYNLTLGSGAGQAAPGDGSTSRPIQELTASGAVTADAQVVDLNHATVVIAATMNALNHPGLFIVRDTSASGTAAHTVTLTAGTWNGTNTIATLNAPGETLVVFFDENGRGTIIENTGAVALS
jgi:hypothetical protein